MRGKTVKLGLPGLVIIAAGVAAMRWMGGGGGSDLPPLQTVTVEQADVRQEVQATGRLQPIQMVDVSSEVSGELKAVHVDFNDHVRAGQPLAQIDSSTFASDLRSAQAALDAAQANVDFARQEWERVLTLEENRVIPPAELEEARSTLRQAEAQLAQQENAVEVAERELDQTTIYAPTDGMVISRNVEPGQTVAAGFEAPTLFQIAADLSLMHIHAEVSEADIGVVGEGQPVRFTVDAYRGQDFEGEVTQVRNAPQIQSNVVYYETIIAVDNEELLLKPGMTSEAHIVVDEVLDAVAAPNSGLRPRLPPRLEPPPDDDEPQGRREVFVLEDGEIRRRWVETGMSDGYRTEILDGLEAGDTLVVGVRPRMESDEGGGGGFFQADPAQF